MGVWGGTSTPRAEPASALRVVVRGGRCSSRGSKRRSSVLRTRQEGLPAASAFCETCWIPSWPLCKRSLIAGWQRGRGTAKRRDSVCGGTSAQLTACSKSVQGSSGASSIALTPLGREHPPAPGHQGPVGKAAGSKTAREKPRRRGAGARSCTQLGRAPLALRMPTGFAPAAAPGERWLNGEAS